MASLNHGKWKWHRQDHMGTREQPACHKADLLAYAMRPAANINPHTRMTHFAQSMLYYGGHTRGLIGTYRLARAQHIQATCGLGVWPRLMAGPVGFLP